MNRVLIVGATSAIAQACARSFAQRGDALLLTGRQTERLEQMAVDLKTRGASQVETLGFDPIDPEQRNGLLKHCLQSLDGLDIVLLAYGTLPDQKACESSEEEHAKALDVNFISAAALLNQLAPHFTQQGSGTLATISSVAGDRGRQSNYVYGSAKGALTIYLQGLRNRLSKSGVQVLTIKPGFVDTPMTEDFPKGPLWASPETVGKGIVRAIDKGHDVVYLPWFWQIIMLIIRSIPEFVFKRLSL